MQHTLMKRAVKTMSNSSLVTYTNITKHCAKRTQKIKGVAIHCFVGQVTAKQGCDYFANTDREASSNYVIGKDGSIGLSVPESHRAFTTSSRAVDDVCVTIEVASDKTHPYAITDAAYKALIELLVDICKRNSIKQLLWKGDKSLLGQYDKQNMVVHRWIKNKACPGQYLYDRHGQIADEVNKRLGAAVDKKDDATVKVEKYTHKQFVKDVQAATGAKVDGIAGPETLSKTVTVSTSKNKNHAVVTPLERYLKQLGYYTGAIEADAGKKPCFGGGMDKAVRQFQKDNGCVRDGEITKGNKTWKKLLKMI